MFKIIKLEDESAKKIEEKLKENDGYCPCALQKTKETKCMCKEFREQKEIGKCHCGLYEKIEENTKNITTLSHLKKLIGALERIATEHQTDEMEVSFEYLIGSCFPLCFNNIQRELKNQYTLGYLQGKQDAEANLKK